MSVSPPKVSVVMSLYNSERYLKEAIDSVLSQTLTDFEFIIIDDGSQDDGATIVASYDDARIRFISQKNAGLPAALNKAISLAKGDFIARMDPDDICMPNRLATQYDYLCSHPDVAIVGSSAICIDEDGIQLASISKEVLHKLGDSTVPESPCIHPSVMFLYAVYKKVEGYPERMRYGGEDAILFNKILTYGAIVNLTEPLIYYRVHHRSMSQKSKYFNVLLRQMVCREVNNETIIKQDWQILQDAYQSSKSGQYGYHLYLGKLFLSKRGKEKTARGHFYAVMRINPLSLKLWLSWLSSYIPFVWREALKKNMKTIRRR